MKKEAKCSHHKILPKVEVKNPRGFQAINFVRGEPLKTVPTEGISVAEDLKQNLKRGEFRSSLVDCVVC